jgi:sulfur carrier protein ThiS
MSTVKVGQMPGRINEYAVEEGTSIRALLELAELNPTGFDVKVDGVKVTDLDNTTVSATTSMVILAQQVKGNSGGTVKVGKMPGRINEYAVEIGTSIADVLELAELSTDGFDVKVDGVKVTDLSGTQVTDSTSMIILAQQVKGNIA